MTNVEVEHIAAVWILSLTLVFIIGYLWGGSDERNGNGCPQ